MSASNAKPPRKRPGRASGRRPARARPGETPDADASSNVLPEAKLVCIAGIQRGSEYLLEGEKVVVGRAPHNAVSIPDNSISREHFQLRRTPEGWMAADLASANGSFVNGAPLEEELLLGHGDQIILGDTELEFVSPGAQPERGLAKLSASEGRSPRKALAASRRNLRLQEEMQKKKKRRMLLLLLLVMVGAFVGASMYVKTQQRKKDQKTSYEYELLAQRERLLNERFQNAKNLIRSGEWLEAQHALRELSEQAPDFQQIKEIQGYLTIAEEEVPNQAAMNEAQDALNLLELKEAKSCLDRVTETQHQYERLRALREALQAGVRKKVAAAHALTSDTANRESMVKLKHMSDDVLAVVPTHREALGLQTMAMEAIHRIDNPYRPPPRPDTPWVSVTESYKAGQIEEATRLADACAAKHARCKKLHGQLENFANKNRRIEALTPREFFDFHELDKQLSEGAGSANTKRILLFAGPAIEKAALSAKLAGRLGEATGLASGLLKIDPKNTTAQSIMQEVRAQAQETFLRAYTLLRSSQPDQAEPLFKEVTRMLPKNEEYVQKAQAQLDALKGKPSDAE